MIDIEIIFVILNIILMTLAILTIYKPILLIAGVPLSGVMLTQTLNNELSPFMNTLTIVLVFVYFGCLIIGLSRNRGI